MESLHLVSSINIYPEVELTYPRTDLVVAARDLREALEVFGIGFLLVSEWEPCSSIPRPRGSDIASSPASVCLDLALASSSVRLI